MWAKYITFFHWKSRQGHPKGVHERCSPATFEEFIKGILGKIGPWVIKCPFLRLTPETQNNFLYCPGRTPFWLLAIFGRNHRCV